MKKKKILGLFSVIGMCCIVLMTFISCPGGTGDGTDGNGTVTSIDNALGNWPPFTPEASDSTPFGVFGTIPPDGMTGVPPTASIVIFFNDEVDPSSVSSDSVQITDNGSPVSGQFGGVLDAAGNTVLFFVPDSPFGENSTISITLPSGGVTTLEDDGGNSLSTDYPFSFTTGTALASVPGSNLGFEQGLTGYTILGDGAVLTGKQGEVGPTEGQNMAGISTGEMHLSSSFSLDSTTTFLFSGSISVPQGATKMSFDFDFISEEFDEFVELGFDDFFVVAAVGPSGVFAALVASVDLVGEAASIPLTSLGSIPLIVYDVFPATTDHTDWVTVEIPNISSLGSPIQLGFAVSDVGDAIYDTLVFIDNIRFQ